jgi:hypothetical protein
MNALRAVAAACLFAMFAAPASHAVEPFQPDGPSDTVTPQPVETAAPIDAAIDADDEAEEKKGFFERKHKGYLGYMFGELEKIGELDIYGVSGQLPKGYLGFKYQWTTIKAGARFGENGTKGPVATPIEFTNSNGDKVVSIDLGLSGKGHGHNFMVSYGISNPVDFYVELPFTFMDVKLQPKHRSGQCQRRHLRPDLRQDRGLQSADLRRQRLPLRHPAPTGPRHAPDALRGQVAARRREHGILVELPAQSATSRTP